MRWPLLLGCQTADQAGLAVQIVATLATTVATIAAWRAARANRATVDLMRSERLDERARRSFDELERIHELAGLRPRPTSGVVWVAGPGVLAG